MLTKEERLLLFIIIFLNYINNECRIIQCYSCSDCATSTLLNISKIQILNDIDQCVKITILTRTFSGQRKQIDRGVSQHCKDYLNTQISRLITEFQVSQSLLQCYLCADCGDPFDKEYPYTSVVTNQNYGAACIKTVLTVPNGKVVSRGTTFSCTQASTSDIKGIWHEVETCGLRKTFDEDKCFHLSVKTLTAFALLPIDDVMNAFELLGNKFDDDTDDFHATLKRHG
ncbi:unnamed protein product [Adineta steineri]|uniref:Uncharacterized protein n=1 Tax=Adineta steineri TaxID=433720 RepID=A0A815QN74_9BILA|nr:unnamed protein product [Adineta steineri]CAF1634342.1 unnamed protein product [Adineta steineri]